MTIEMLNRGTILVSLGERDMQAYTLDFGAENITDNETGLISLLYRVGEVCGLDCRGKSYSIEALPAQNGCLLIISVRTVRRRRVYRIKRKKTTDLCIFFDADAMLDYLGAGRLPGGCAVYAYDGRYVLLPPSALSESDTARLGEYGEIVSVGAAAQARIREHGSLLLQEALQRRHIGGRTVAVRDAAARDRAG